MSSHSLGKKTAIGVVGFICAAVAVCPLGVSAQSGAGPRGHGQISACRVSQRYDAWLSTGRSVAKTSQTTVDFWSACDYQLKNARLFTVLVASTDMIRKWHPKQSARTEYDQAHRGGGKKATVNGVGNQAFWLRNFNIDELWVLKGDEVMSLVGGNESGTITAARRIASKL